MRSNVLALAGLMLAALLQACSSGTAGNPVLDAGASIDAVYPANDYTAAPTNISLSATFSDKMDPNTLDTGTFKLMDASGTPVAGTVSYSGKTAVFKPAAPLATDMMYEATITTGAKCLDGPNLPNDYNWMFTTGAVPDTTPPQVTNTAFAVGKNADIGGGVTAYGGVVVAFFSKTMDPATLTDNTFIVRGPDDVKLAGSVIYLGVVAVFTPTQPFLPNTVYTAEVTTGAKDLAGNGLAKDRIWQFTTPEISVLSGKSTTVTATAPNDDALGVVLSSKITITFNTVMDATTINADTIKVTALGLPVLGTVSYTGITATFTPSAPLLPDRMYEVEVTAGAKSLEGIGMDNAYDFLFTTGTDLAGTPPVVQFSTPTPDQTDVALNMSVLVSFDEPMDPATLTTANFTLTDQLGEPVSGMVSYSGLTAVFTPDSQLVPGITYTARVSAAVTDLSGTHMANDCAWSFSTGQDLGTDVPVVLFTNPANGAMRIPWQSYQLQIAFSEVVDPLTINSSTIVMTGPDGTPVPGTFTYLAYAVTFTPSVPLAQYSQYTVTVTTGVHDLEGTPMSADYRWWFMTDGSM